MTDIVDRAAVVLLGLVAGSLAEAQDRLTLVDAVTRALSYYPSVQASAAQVEAADATLDEAESARFPTVSVGLNANHYQEPMLAHPIHAFTPALIPPFDQNLIQAFADVRYQLFDGGGRSSRIDGKQGPPAERRIDASRSAPAAPFADHPAIPVGPLPGAYPRSPGPLDPGSRGRALPRQASFRCGPRGDGRRPARRSLDRRGAGRAGSPILFPRPGPEEPRRALSVPRRTRRGWRTSFLSLSPGRRFPPWGGDRNALESSPSTRLARDAGGGGGDARWEPLPAASLDRLDGRYINYGSASGANSLEWNVGVSLAYTVFNGGEVSSAVARSESAARGASERLRWTGSRSRAKSTAAFRRWRNPKRGSRA